MPHARFLLHGVSSGFEANARRKEKRIEERLKGLRIDTLNIARVLLANAGMSEGDAVAAMRDRATLDPGEAKWRGLVQEIGAERFPAGSRIVSIQK